MMGSTQGYLTDKRRENLFRRLTKGSAILVFILFMAIILSLFMQSWQSISQFSWGFLWQGEWDPVANQYGALVPIVGTVITSSIALMIAVPISFGIAIFLSEIAPDWLSKPIAVAIEMLAAIPSIIYGMWGLFVFVPLFQQYVQPYFIDYLSLIPLLGTLFDDAPFGVGLFSAGLVLAIMIIPFIASVMRDIFSSVPAILKESAYGLGATKWEVARSVILPYSRTGIVGAMMLGLGRALGETMAVTFVIGNTFRLPESIFSPSTSIASAIANEFNEASGLQKSALIEAGLLLFLITTFVLVLSRLFIARMQKKEGR